MSGITSPFVRIPGLPDPPVYYPKYMYLYKENKGHTQEYVFGSDISSLHQTDKKNNGQKCFVSFSREMIK